MINRRRFIQLCALGGVAPRVFAQPGKVKVGILSPRPLAVSFLTPTLLRRLAELGYRQGETVKSIPVWETQGWEYLDKGHIVLGHAPGRRYLVAFSSPCDNLSFSNRLNIGSTVGAVTRLDRILSYDSSGIPEPCLIGELYRLERLPSRAE